MNNKEMAQAIVDSKLGKLACKRIERKKFVVSGKCLGYYVDFLELILKGYEILNMATKKGIRI